jgi:2-phospho-L-lactate guanylyltransferase
MPVKGGPHAKTRLGAGPRLALALALDSLLAVTDCPLVARVVVVAGDPQVGPAVRAVCDRVEVVPETHSGAGLVAAIRDGVLAADDGTPPAVGSASRVAVLLADVPAMRPADLATALDAASAALAAGARMVAVPDAEGRGTVLLAATDATDLDPAFGSDSLATHIRRGARVLDLDLPRLRRDVDTPAQLETAAALGLGPHTRLALACAAPCPAETGGF